MTSLRKKTGIVLGLALLGLFLLNIASVTALGSTEEPIGTNQATRHMNAGDTKSFRFRSQTRLSFSSTHNLTVNMNVDADNIGDKDITIELNCSEPVMMNMTCKATEAGLGMQNGSTVQTRAQNRYQYQYGFIANISVNCTHFTARLRAQVGNLNGLVWAFYNETAGEWEEVPTNTVNGEAIAEINHFSTWTLLSPESTASTVGIEYLGILVAGFAAIGVMAVILKMRKRT